MLRPGAQPKRSRTMPVPPQPATLRRSTNSRSSLSQEILFPRRTAKPSSGSARPQPGIMRQVKRCLGFSTPGVRVFIPILNARWNSSIQQLWQETPTLSITSGLRWNTASEHLRILTGLSPGTASPVPRGMCFHSSKSANAMKPESAAGRIPYRLRSGFAARHPRVTRRLSSSSGFLRE